MLERTPACASISMSNEPRTRSAFRAGGMAPPGSTPRHFRRCGMMAAAALLALLAQPAIAGCDSLPAPAEGYPLGDAERDAARGGEQTVLQRISIPGVTDIEKDQASVNLVDLDKDGAMDIFVLYNDGQMRMFLNEGCWTFTEHPFDVVDSGWTYDAPPGGAGIANFADFNDDGFKDIYITRNLETFNFTQRAPVPNMGNSLLLSQGRFDRFVDRGVQMGVANLGAYSRGSSFADVNGDGWLDIAVGADIIGQPLFGGFPHHRLYVYRPGGAHFEDGRFEDIGGTDAVPDFGGQYQCDAARDRGGPAIMLRDLDSDGRQDLIQGYHNDPFTSPSNQTGLPLPPICTSLELKFGIYAWRNITGLGEATRFAPIPPEQTAAPEDIPDGLTSSGQCEYDQQTQSWNLAQNALSHAFIFAADFRNVGRLDLITIGREQADPPCVKNEIAGKYWRNDGDFNFSDASPSVGPVIDGRGMLNWRWPQMGAFYDAAFMKERDQAQRPGTISPGDFNNDGCLDFILGDRKENAGVSRPKPDGKNGDDPGYGAGALRNTLVLNNCDGSFSAQTTEVSGMSTNSTAAEVADLDGDGRLDVVLGAQPSNAGLNAALATEEVDRFLTKVFRNRGGLGGETNNWVSIRLAGLPERQLIGARIDAWTNDGTDGRRYLGRRDYVTNDGYKSGHDTLAHYGLASGTSVDVEVRLPDGRVRAFTDLTANHGHVLDVSDAASRTQAGQRAGEQAKGGLISWSALFLVTAALALRTARRRRASESRGQR